MKAMKRSFSLLRRIGVASQNKQQGMTLLEVLVALAIFATAAMSVFRAIGMHVQTLSYLEEKTLASMVADNQLALMKLKSPPKSAQKGEYEMAGHTWYWTLTPVKTAVSYIQAVDVSISLDRNREDEILSVRTYVVPES